MAGGIGIPLYMRYVPKIGWVSRYALAIYVAYYIGVEFTRRLHGEVLPQLSRTILPLWPWSQATLVSLVFIVGLQRAGLLLPRLGAERGDAADRADGDLVPDDLVRRGLRVHRDGRIALLLGRLNFLILDWLYPAIGI